MSQAEQTYQAIIDKLRAKNRQQADRIAELENELELTRESYATSLQIIDQQADRIAELEKFTKAILKKGGYPYKPLSDEEILNCLNHLEISESGKKHQIQFARAIEAKVRGQ